MYQYPFLDFQQLNESLNNPASRKLPEIYEKMGGVFHDDEKELMAGAVVGIVTIGGLPVTVIDNEIHILGKNTNIENIKNEFKKTYGMSSFMSYLNPKGKSLQALGQDTLDKDHTSVLHTVSLGILIVGITSGVEHELSSQRDIVHLSRLTVAKTKAQETPCLVLRNTKYKEAYKAILKQTKHALLQIEDGDLETRNLLYPTSKASAVMITGSIKNLKKLIALKDAGGKEDELIEVLNKMEKALSFLV